MSFLRRFIRGDLGLAVGRVARKLWQWWRRNCVAVAMFVLLGLVGWAAVELHAIADRLSVRTDLGLRVGIARILDYELQHVSERPAYMISMERRLSALEDEIVRIKRP